MWRQTNHLLTITNHQNTNSLVLLCIWKLLVSYTARNCKHHRYYSATKLQLFRIVSTYPAYYKRNTKTNGIASTYSDYNKLGWNCKELAYKTIHRQRFPPSKSLGGQNEPLFLKSHNEQNFELLQKSIKKSLHWPRQKFLEKEIMRKIL